MPARFWSGIAPSLPRRLIWGVLGLGTLATAAMLLMTFGSKPAQPPATFSETPAGLAGLERDEDHDGLKNWEEALYGSDRRNPDSDGDGTKDGDEVLLNRNPLAAGPGDEIGPPPAEGTNAEEASNLTSRFVKLLAESGVLKASRSQRDAEAKAFLARIAQSKNFNADQILAQAASVKRSDIRTAAANDPAAVKQYFNAVYAVYAAYLVPLPRDDIGILSQALDTQDYSRLSELNSIAYALGRSFEEIQAIPVPRGYEEFAVRELNYILKTKKGVEVLARLDRDPAAAALMYPARLKLRRQVGIFHWLISATLTARGITFNPGEGGYAYFH